MQRYVAAVVSLIYLTLANVRCTTATQAFVSLSELAKLPKYALPSNTGILPLEIDGRQVNLILQRHGSGNNATTLVEEITSGVADSFFLGHAKAELHQAVAFAWEKLEPATSPLVTFGSVQRKQQVRNTLNLIVQFRDSDASSMVEWLSELLDPQDRNKYVLNVTHDNGEMKSVLPNSMVVYHTEMCEVNNTVLLKYLERFDELEYSYGIIHLHDERLGGCRVHYPMAKVVLRNNGHDSFFENQFAKNVLEIPMGYQHGSPKKGAGSDTFIKPSSTRRFLWSFMGDTTKSWRSLMLKELSTLASTIHPRSYYLRSYTQWQDPSMTPPETYSSLLGDSILCPCPIGNVYPTFGSNGDHYGTNTIYPNSWNNIRVYEAIQQGCIPILEDLSELYHHSSITWEDSHRHFLGRYNDFRHDPPPVLYVSLDWSNVTQVLESVNEFTVDYLDEIQRNLLDWFARLTRNTSNAIQDHVWNGIFEETDDGTSIMKYHGGQYWALFAKG